MSAIVRTEGLVKRYDRHARRRRRRPDRRRGRDLRPGRARTAPARRPRCGCWRRCSGRRPATAEIAGWSVTRNPDEVRRVLGFMPDVFGVYDDMKVWEYLDFFARCYGLPAAGRRRMIADLLELVDLGDKRDAYVQTLSRGMQQRLCLAHALVHDPAGAAARRAGLGPRPARPGRAARAAPRAALAGQDDPHQQPHPARARGAVHERRDRRPRPGARPGPRRATSSGGCASGPSCGSASSLEGEALEAARDRFAADAGRRLGDDPRRRHDRARVPRRRRRVRPPARRVGGGGPRRSSASPAPPATSRSCSSRSPRPTANPWKRREDATMTDVPIDAVETAARRGHRPADPAGRARTARRLAGRSVASGTSAGVGRRSASRSSAAGCAAGGPSSILTIYLLLLGGFAWMVELLDGADLLERLRRHRRRSPRRPIGQGIFAALLMLETLQVVVPGARRRRPGAISLEREKQTLELLVDDADLVARDRHRQAAQRADLRLPADRRVDPADRRRLRLRRGRPRRRPARLPRAARHRPRARGRSGCSARASSSGPRRRPRSRSSASSSITVGSVFVLVFWAGDGRSTTTARGAGRSRAARRQIARAT